MIQQKKGGKKKYRRTGAEQVSFSLKLKPNMNLAWLLHNPKMLEEKQEVWVFGSLRNISESW